MTRKMSLKAGIPLFYAFLRTMSTGRGHAGLCNTHCLVYVDLVSERVMFSIFYFFPYNIYRFFGNFASYTPVTLIPQAFRVCPWPCDYAVLTKKETITTTKEPKSNLCSLYTTWSMVKLPVTCHFSRTEFFPTPPEAISCRELHFSIPVTLSNFSSTTSCLGRYFSWREGRDGSRGCHRGLPCPPLSTVQPLSWISQSKQISRSSGS